MKRIKNIEQKITLTKTQFKALLKAVYLGNWMANAYRDGSKEHPYIKDYENIEDYVFSLAPLFSLNKYMDHEESDGNKYYPTSFFEEETDVHILHEQYDENSFWDELIDHLGERDFREKYSEKEINTMSRIEFFEKLDECIDIYREEFEKFGIQRLRINGKEYNKYN